MEKEMEAWVKEQATAYPRGKNFGYIEIGWSEIHNMEMAAYYAGAYAMYEKIKQHLPVNGCHDVAKYYEEE